MDFNNLYLTAITLWPKKIDVSDGVASVDGVLFPKLSSIWNQVEAEAIRKGDWYDLMTWIIFNALHRTAKENLLVGQTYVYPAQIDLTMVRLMFEDNLRAEGYEEMLEEYIKANKNI